ncbi:MAG: isoprenylcysteine carboxylmethyltransferase family protein [Pseudomonadota bacterium]|nr:isoprenylcysteine carboxylmethyltransferase family protein [Pseudomonadota bacterium]
MSTTGRGLRRWLKSTSNRTFVVYPLLLVLVEFLLQRGTLRINFWSVPLLVWGYLQYRLVGNYRLREGGGGPGMSVPPERLVTSGPYRYTRNPMYLGHIIFMLGLALVLSSWLAALLLLFHLFWFNERAKEDEEQMHRLFGALYDTYVARVRRWIPFVY